MTLVLINDYVMDKRIKLFFSHEDFAITDGEWESKDALLRDLQRHSVFEGRERWCDLEPFHYRLMITKSLEVTANMSDAERLGQDDLRLRSLNFLICCLIRCVEQKADSHIELLKIHRVEDLEVSFEYSAVMSMEMPRSKPKKGFSVIVDNT